MKSFNRGCHHFPALALTLVLAASLSCCSNGGRSGAGGGTPPVPAALAPSDVLELHQRWLDGTDNFLADVYVVAVEDKNETQVAKGLLLSDQTTGDVSFQRVEICVEIPEALRALHVERWAGGARAGVAGIGFSDVALTSGPFGRGSWQLFSRGSTAAETLERLDTIASDVRAVEGTGLLAGLEGLVISIDQTFKRRYQGIVEQMLGGELMAEGEWSDPQQLELWFDAEDGRIHQISSIARGVRRDVLFDYAAIDLSPAELAETREKLAVRTSDETAFSSFVELMDAVVGARSSPPAARAGLPLVAGILLLLVGRALRRLS